MWFVGIDLADKKHDICFLQTSGKVFKEFTVPHSPEGLDQLLAELRSLSSEVRDIFIGAETPRRLFIQYLHSLGYTVYAINPKSVDRGRDRFSPAGAKDDSRDAHVLADLLRTDRHQYRPIRMDSALLEELRVLVEDREALVRDRVRLENQITSCLKDYFPVALDCFCKLDQKITIAFLRKYPSPFEFAKANILDLSQLLKEHRHPQWKEKAKQLDELARQPQLPVSVAITRSKSRFLLSLLNQLEPLLQDLEQYDQEIEALVKLHPDSQIFLDLKGVGANLAARLLVYFGEDRSYYPNANALQCEAGTAPVTRRSGKRKTVHFRRACKKPFRNTMQIFATQMVRYHDWCKEAFLTHRKRGRGKSECYRIVANTWLRILFAMWQNRTTYDPEIFQQAKLRNAA